jgi:hypothetical protein
MAANVTEKVMTRRRRGSRALSSASFLRSFFKNSMGPTIFGLETCGRDSFFSDFKQDNLKPYFVKPFLKLVMETTPQPIGAPPVETSFDVIENVKKHVTQLKPYVPERGLICIGEYPFKILQKDPFLEKLAGILPIVIEKAEGENAKSPQLSQLAAPQNMLEVDADVDTHFWFNVTTYLAANEELSTRLRKATEKLHEATVFASLWEGLGSAMLPMLLAQFRKSNASSVALAVLPSKAQPSDAHFNALASIGMCAAGDSAAVVLVGRDFAENYVGVDRNGSRMKGNFVVNYLLQMMLEKETLTQELSELSRAFNVKLYTGLSIMGASYKVYGSFESMLDAASLNPFLPFDLTSTAIIYVLARVPRSLREILTRGKIELETAEWAKKIPNVKSIYVSEPIYVDDSSDRVDAVALAGGFNVADLTAFLLKKSDKIRTETIKKGLIKEKEWEAIVKSLAIGR